MVDGAILAGRAVRLACARHLNDLQRQRTPEFPFAFDAERAQRIIDFYPTFLTLENGEPFHLLNWQQFCRGSLMGWVRTSDDGRRFQTSYIETGKGSGKTPMLAGLGLYGLGFDGEQSAEIYSAAFDRDQASIVLNDAIRMGKAEDELNGEHGGIFEINKYNIAEVPSQSFFRAVSSEHRSKSGPRPHMVLIDELHEHRDGAVVNKMRAGFKGRKQPVLEAITNSGHDRTSICWTYHQHSLAVLEGAVTDEQWFAYVCQLDPCERCYGEGYRQPKEGCPYCDAWTDQKVWPKANPSLGVTIQPSYLQTQVDLALSMPSEQALVKRLNFCLWTETHQVWMPADRWDACQVEKVSADNAAMRPCAIGIDPASTRDLAAAVVAIRCEDEQTGQAPTVEIDGMNEAGERITLAFTLNYTVELVPFFWMPQESLLERVRTERVPLDVWAKQGCITATPGPAIDHQAVYADVMGLWKRFKAQRIGMDENGGRFLFMKLRDEGKLGEQIVSVGQGKKLSEAYKFLEILIAHRRLKHNGHPVLAWCVANAEPKRDRLNALWLEKPSETKRIDGIVAAAMAVHQLMAIPARRKRAAVAVV